LLQNKHDILFCYLYDKIVGKTYIKIGKIKKKHKHETNYWEVKETNSSMEMNWKRWKGIRIEPDGATMEKWNRKILFLSYVIGLVHV